MAILALSKLNKLFCCIRKEWVYATEEEKIRQKILGYLIHDLGFPASGIVVERSLNTCVQGQEKVPARRIDVLCYGGQLCTPLLVVECKAVPLTDKMMRQLCGYNRFINAPSYALVNSTQIVCSLRGHSRDSLPRYEEVIM